jgi:hypothetical protein
VFLINIFFSLFFFHTVMTEKSFSELYQVYLSKQQNQDSFTTACLTWLQLEHTRVKCVTWKQVRHVM